MAHLYKFTCKPNYPVVAAATLVFVWGPSEAPEWKYMIEYAKNLAISEGFVHTEDEPKLSYCGQIHSYAGDTPIICAISGEY